MSGARRSRRESERTDVGRTAPSSSHLAAQREKNEVVHGVDQLGKERGEKGEGVQEDKDEKLTRLGSLPARSSSSASIRSQKRLWTQRSNWTVEVKLS